MYRPEDLIFRQGITFEKTWWWREKDRVTPIPLDGLEARMRLAVSYAAPEPLFTLTSAPSGGMTLTTAEGRIDARLAATVTDGLPPGKDYVYVLELYDPNDATEVLHFISGKAEVKPKVPA